MSTDPSLIPVHVALNGKIKKPKGSGDSIVNSSAVSHADVSVTVTMYSPAHKPRLSVKKVPEVWLKYPTVNSPLPPMAVTSTAPSQSKPHDGLVTSPTINSSGAGSSTVMNAVSEVQFNASYTHTW